jgi:hypothetical protein
MSPREDHAQHDHAIVEASGASAVPHIKGLADFNLTLSAVGLSNNSNFVGRLRNVVVSISIQLPLHRAIRRREEREARRPGPPTQMEHSRP